jgi:hypothetical protein
MKLRIQFAGWLIALGISVAMALPSAAQKHDANRPPQQQRQQQRQTQQQRQPQRQERGQARPEARRPPNGGNADRPHNIAPPNRPTESMSTLGGGNRPPNAGNQPGQRPNFNPNRPPNASNRSGNLSPQERQKLQQDERRFRQLPPQQQQEMRDRARVWGKLTPEQQNHIRGDVLPKWQQMPPDRQRAIRQRLGVLQNMPESARNQHLNDPNFTRGMSEEDRAMLRDLSHMHVGAPDPPNE